MHRCAFSYTTLQVLLWHYIGLDYRYVSAEELRQQPEITDAQLALNTLFVEQHYDGYQHECH